MKAINREWAMPSKNTFTIKPIKELVWRHLEGKEFVLDPFSGNNPFKEYCITNDLNGEVDADYHLDALDFLKGFADRSCDLVLFDPPFSPRQVSECYKTLGKSVNMQTTQARFWGNLKKEIARLVKNEGYVITCGWNSGGIGKTQGFEIEEILLVAHGGWHNDTIVTVEKKRKIKKPLTNNRQQIQYNFLLK